MENKMARRSLSAIVIVAMIGTMFALPIFGNDDIYAASKKKVKVTFKANSGKFSKGAKKTKKIVKGKKLGTLPKVTKSGYKFKGWYTKKKGGKKYTKKTKIKKKTTLYAQWTKKASSTTPTTPTSPTTPSGPVEKYTVDEKYPNYVGTKYTDLNAFKTAFPDFTQHDQNIFTKTYYFWSNTGVMWPSGDITVQETTEPEVRIDIFKVAVKYILTDLEGQVDYETFLKNMGVYGVSGTTYKAGDNVTFMRKGIKWKVHLSPSDTVSPDMSISLTYV